MTTIYTKEIERLEKEINGFGMIVTESLAEEICCLEIELNTLKQAEQKHLKFVEELNRLIHKGLIERYEGEEHTDTPIHLSDLRYFVREIDNLSKGDEK